MPRLRYTGGSRYALRDGPTWEDDDVNEVDGDTADRLGDLDKFEIVEDGSDEDTTTDNPEQDEAGHLRDQPPEVQIEENVCPWCPPDERYEGNAVGRHASAVHPDEWDKYKGDDN